MADEPQLKQVYRAMAASDSEMADYRSRLATELTNQPRSWHNALSWWQMLLIPAFGLLIWFAVPQSQQPNWYEIDSLESLLSQTHETSSVALREQAQVAFDQYQGQVSANARALLVLTLEGEGQAIDLASEGLHTEPRPEFRQFYLEWLLDRWDHYQWNTERYEQLMETEEDPVCLALYATFLERT